MQTMLRLGSLQVCLLAMSCFLTGRIGPDTLTAVIRTPFHGVVPPQPITRTGAPTRTGNGRKQASAYQALG